MRVFIAVLVLIFSLQSWTRADDIRDFQIEGMNIGKSILDYYSEKEIKKNIKSYMKDKTFSLVETENIKSEIYNAIQLHYKTKDKKYIIHGISGVVDCANDFSICENQWDNVVTDLSNFFGNSATKSDKIVKKHAKDKSGKSIGTEIEFKLDSGDVALIQLTDWSNKMRYSDNLMISIGTKEISDWYDNQPDN